MAATLISICATSPHGPIRTLAVEAPVRHTDFTPKGRSQATGTAGEDGLKDTSATALTDNLGHGTHVAGIIAGYRQSSIPEGDFVAGTEERNDFGDEEPIRRRERLRLISGVSRPHAAS